MGEAARPNAEAADRRSFTYSVVIPVYNSEDLVGRPSTGWSRSSRRPG